jgi:hypothetical protein
MNGRRKIDWGDFVEVATKGGKGVPGGWRKLHNEELRNFCSSPDTIRVIKARNILLGKPEGKDTVKICFT